MSVAISFAEAGYYNGNGEGLENSSDRKVVQLLIDEIKTNPFQPRKIFIKEALSELSESIREYGVLQPITVRKLSNGTYELIAGERRLRASKMADMKYIPAIIYEFDDDDSAVIALIENLQRESLSFLEEAEAYYCLVMDHGITQEQLAQKVGKSQSTIANKVRLLKLPPLVQKIINDNNLTERHARALLRLPDEQLQLKALKAICDHHYTVQKTEDFISDILAKNVIPYKKSNEFSGKKNYEECGLSTRRMVINEINLFVRNLKSLINSIVRSGLIVHAAQFDRKDYYEFVIRIPKKDNGLSSNAEF
ncbi:MAG: ParB/RepB/Spo0J family partition protein [Clostridia bacterium]|nr:ParB/RepB/Spo0J family partition protein [Clostridia bacterium]